MTPCPHFVLASTSPRRSQLLKEAGFEFHCVDPGDEGKLDLSSVEAMVKGLALRKAESGLSRLPDEHLQLGVVGADTLVCLDGRVLGKPVDKKEARAMLQALSGASHQVWTGCALVFDDGRQFVRADSADIKFAQIPSSALEAYLNTPEWQDKAGAYGIQAWAGQWATVTSGSIETVIGLDPMAITELFCLADACPPRSK